MLEIVIIISIAVILFILLRKFPQIGEREIRRSQVETSFNWFSFKRKFRAFIRSSWQRLKELFSGQKQALKLRKKKVRRFKVNIPKSYAKAKRLFEKGDLARSEMACLRLITLRPEEARLYYLLYQIYQEKNNTKEAALALKEAIKRQEDGFWLMELGELYQQLKKFSKAEKAVKKAIKMNNTIALRFATLAGIQLKRGKRREALENVITALEMEPHNIGYQELKAEIEKD